MAEPGWGVSRETSPGPEPEPAAAAEVLGAALELGRRYAADLIEHGERLGLIGPLEVGRVWTRHVLNSALVAPFLQSGGRLADIGSGAGLPGLVLALVRPDVEVTLIEPMERRTDWLRDESARLGLTNVTVLRARAEDARDAGPFDQVTARAVSALRTLIPITAPLVRAGGELLFLKGARVDDEIAAATKVLQKHRVRDIAVLELGVGLLPEITRLFRATVGGAS
ncbi:16S rRNA (guanine(527)-N(7))-methyltransferase RsmG [Microcella frigidaquae]|uniref:Ribosomal RNA small subunit methyltransferase G n=1 Tax=Microcella frigidaquae TaxID=424758 RepID=A0A840X9Z0_9MICO|nr:16S rRNA (guanine527-N7)-methyltransferase [Microcella frigidaquae]